MPAASSGRAGPLVAGVETYSAGGLPLLGVGAEDVFCGGVDSDFDPEYSCGGHDLAAGEKPDADRDAATGILVAVVIFGWLAGLMGVGHRSCELKSAVRIKGVVFAVLRFRTWGMAMGGAHFPSRIEMGSGPETELPVAGPKETQLDFGPCHPRFPLFTIRWPSAIFARFAR